MTSVVKNNCGKINAKPLPWFRFYTEALDDPKVQRLPPHLFKAWVNLLCLAGQNNGQLPSIDDIAFRLRLSAQDAEQQISDLILAGLIDITETGRAPHNWGKRQFQSDRSTERVKKHRRNKAETACNVSETATETPPDTDTDTDTDSEKIRIIPETIHPEPARGDDGGMVCEGHDFDEPETILLVVERAMGGQTKRAVAWLENLSRSVGQSAIDDAFQRFLTAQAQGVVINSPLPWLDSTAKRCKREAWAPPPPKKSALTIIAEMEASNGF